METEKMDNRNVFLKEQCTKLWKEAFCDSDEFISSFMEHHYNEKEMLYIEGNGKLLSMLHLIPFEKDGKPIAYMYAVATECDTRGKGHASRLILSAITKAKEEGFAAVATLPAYKGLYDFYSRFGFKGRYAVKFENTDGFDFGTGNPGEDFITILPLEKNFTISGETAILLKKTKEQI